MTSRVVRSMGLAALCLIAFPVASIAQSQLHPRWEIPGFDFRPNGAWRVKAGHVAAARKQLLASRNFAALNASAMGGPAPSTTTVSGTLLVPALFFGYSTTEGSFMRDTALYSSVLFGATPGPYTLRTYYDEMSDGRLILTGKIMGWVVLPSPEGTYTGPQNCTANPFGTLNCNGVWSTTAILSMQNGFRQALAEVDGAIDFRQFDNDGPDGTPNSGDDDGRVDMMMFAHATRDGACGGATNNHIWSHRYVFVNAMRNYDDYVTNDPSAEGGTIKISDYFATSALGGSTPGTSPCDENQIMPIGTAAHEFGHALGLPDLYDVDQVTEGIGQWGLMGSGNFTAPWSPSRMESWSLNQLGWLRALVPLTAATNTYRLGAAPVSDTAFVVNVPAPNPRSESFLIENRQGAQADTALIRIHCSRSGNPPGCAGGLLIWHVDGQQIASNSFRGANRVNVGAIHGLRLMQADGLRQLDDPNASAPRRRGDAGDQYPGVSGNTAFGPRSNPRPVKNVDGSFAGLAVDQITQVVPGGEMSFRLRFGALTVVQGTDAAAIVKVDGVFFNTFRDLLDDGSIHSISIDSPHVSLDGRRQFHFVSWSDGGLRTHDITGNLTGGGTYTATVTRDFKVIATVSGSGTITPDTAIDLTGGTFVREGRAVQLTATMSGGETFAGWRGDTSSSNPVITLPMGRPYTLVAYFAAPVTTAAAVAHLLGPTAPLSAGQLVYLDTRGNDNGNFDIGDFLAWVKATGAPLSADVMAKLTAGKGGR